MSQITLSGQVVQPSPRTSLPSLEVIYKPSGRAREYADLACNLYAGCSNGCKYCYAPNILKKTHEQFHFYCDPRPEILEKLERDCQKLEGLTVPSVLLCFTCDPYQSEDGLTRKALEIFRSYNVPFTILTKGGMKAVRDFDLYNHQDTFASTLTFVDRQLSAEWEPFAAPPGDRIQALKTAHEMQIKTWVSLEPVIFPAETFQLIRATHEFVDLYKVGKLNYHPRAKKINWRAFLQGVTRLLKALDKDYYIKQDLRKFQ